MAVAAEEEADFVFNVYSIRAWHSSQETRHDIFSSLFLSFLVLSLKISCALTIDGCAAISHV